MTPFAKLTWQDVQAMELVGGYWEAIDEYCALGSCQKYRAKIVAVSWDEGKPSFTVDEVRRFNRGTLRWEAAENSGEVKHLAAHEGVCLAEENKPGCFFTNPMPVGDGRILYQVCFSGPRCLIYPLGCIPPPEPWLMEAGNPY